LGPVKKKMPNGIDKEVFLRLKKIRGDLSQKEFAKVLGINQGTVCKYESGRLPDAITLNKIAEYGGVTVEWLLYGDRAQAREAEAVFDKPRPGAAGLDSPYLFAAVDKSILADIIEQVETGLRRKKKSLSPVRYAHLLSLLYDRYQETGQPLSRSTIEDFLKLV